MSLRNRSDFAAACSALDGHRLRLPEFGNLRRRCPVGQSRFSLGCQESSVDWKFGLRKFCSRIFDSQ